MEADLLMLLIVKAFNCSMLCLLCMCLTLRVVMSLCWCGCKLEIQVLSGNPSDVVLHPENRKRKYDDVRNYRYIIFQLKDLISYITMPRLSNIVHTV